MAVIDSQKGQRKPSFCGLIQLRDKNWKSPSKEEDKLQKEMTNKETEALNGLISTYKYGSKTVYLVEDKGMTYKEYVQKHEKDLDFNSQKIQIARSFQEAVREMHKAKIVHRDLKPENLLVKVTDGGIKVSINDLTVWRKKGKKIKKMKNHGAFGEH